MEQKALQSGQDFNTTFAMLEECIVEEPGQAEGIIYSDQARMMQPNHHAGPSEANAHPEGVCSRLGTQQLDGHKRKGSHFSVEMVSKTAPLHSYK